MRCPREDDMYQDGGDVQRLVSERGDEEAMRSSELRFCDRMCWDGPCDLPVDHEGECACLVSQSAGVSS